MTIIDLNRAFSTEEKCREYLCRSRWPHGVACPRCQAKTISRLKTQKKFECSKCFYQFSETANTIFHDSHLPLEKWFLATYIMCESRKGVSANQLKRVLGTSYKTAWYLCHRIRAAMKDADTTPLSGVIEVDETYVGGRNRHGRGKGLDNKTMVLGAISRGGEVRLKVDKRATGRILRTFVRQTTDKGPKTIYTDDFPGYKALGGDKGVTHDTVNHSEEEWVRGQVHTNTIEGVFSLFKRSIVGSYHQISAKHLPAYLDEFEFRFNRRRRSDLFADTIKHLVKADKMPFRALVKRS
ncbi:MAG TPA: IS1595 family transposase [Vicinamibacterales bacterium]|nr:IS1595 family transposase [Vicinamibacterales bacterium]